MHLESEIQYLQGVGPKRAEALREIGIDSVWDLLNYFPRRYIDRRHTARIKDLRVGESATIVGTVENFELVMNRKRYGSRFRLILADDTGHVNLVWFQGARYYERAFEVGEVLAVYGKLDLYGRELQITHPEFDRIETDEREGFLNTGSIISLYPSSEALRKKWLDSRGFRKLIKPALELADQIPETLSDDVIARHSLMSIKDTYRQIHFPSDEASLEKARERIKFEELFYLQLLLAFRKRRIASTEQGIAFEKVANKTRELISKLPFELTDGQKKALKEIREDMHAPRCMNRLLQGDVGSGKTIVALLAMMIAVENDFQAAFMAPTEILAEQHYFVLQEYLWGLNINVALVKGGQKKSEREKILSDILNHQVDIVVGTHAIFQEHVEFSKLGLVVIDEQHRFGVMQRAEIRRKAVIKDIYPDMLVMTATPIPRTLAMAIYGDLDISVINELPSGRRPIRTAARTEEARNKVYEFIRAEAGKGRQCYLVYPLIDESEKMDLKAAKDGYTILSEKIFKDLRVGLLHGKMKSAEKQEVMSRFKNHQLDILVSTTVIEVGVNVPNSTIMLIEHAERFGLTQLHQLRGRVGRGADQSYCILMIGDQASEESQKRTRIMEKTTDGFKIAEEDLKIRGPGEFFGTKQSGVPELKMAHLIHDHALLQTARDTAFEIIDKDPQLRAAGHQVMKKKFLAEYSDKLHLSGIG